MNNKSIFASQWLSTFDADLASVSNKLNHGIATSTTPENLLLKEIEQNRIRALRSYLPSFKNRSLDKNNQLSQDKNNFQPSRHFLMGWEAETLLSKQAIKFKKIIDKIYISSKSEFISNDIFNSSQKNKIYEEFLYFSNEMAFNATEVDTVEKFFSHLKNPNSKYKNEFEQFVKIYCYRISVIYFLKLRLILTISQTADTEITVSHICNPSSYFNSVFKKASSLEIQTKAITPNVFSWYRPDQSLAKELLEDLKETSSLSISEIIKHSSSLTRIPNDQNLYSHSISHRNFGLFLNSLLINFPLWLEGVDKNENELLSYGTKNEIEATSCKYVGDYLESLAHSLWLAQDNNKHFNWDHMLCPNFENAGQRSDLFFDLFNELQFMTFIVQFAKIHHKNPVIFLADIYRKNSKNKKNTNEFQASFNLVEDKKPQQFFDRLILNLYNFPKNNPNHYLFQAIQDVEDKVKENGFIYLLTDKKLFVPSLKDKVDALLFNFDLECCLSLENIKGRGEVPSFIYILRKKPAPLQGKIQKLECLNFRLDGDLESFQEFAYFIDEIQQFFIQNLTDKPVMYSRQFHRNFSLEYYQDAIVDGRLIRSSKKDSTSITHPTFFKNLLNSCIPFDTFFDIGQLRADNDHSYTLPTIDLAIQDQYPFVCIIDKRNKFEPKIEIINFSAYEAKLHQYGISQCHYFGIRPKLLDLNLNIFREYFKSKLGKQIVMITFEGSSKKIKSKLNSLLIPKMFKNNQLIPEHIIKGFSLLNSTIDELSKFEPREMKQQFSYLETFITTIIKNYPAQAFGHLTYFKNNLQELVENKGVSQKISFDHPLIIKELTQLKTYPLYPENEEVFVDFMVNETMAIHKPLTDIKILKQAGFSSLMLSSEDANILSLNCPDYAANLLDLILKSLKNVPISQILSGVKIPKNDELKSLIQKYESNGAQLRELYNDLQNLMDKILTNLINYK